MPAFISTVILSKAAAFLHRKISSLVPKTELDPRQRQKDYVAKTWASGIMKMKFNFN
jgi:hypothetical protein